MAEVGALFDGVAGGVDVCVDDGLEVGLGAAGGAVCVEVFGGLEVRAVHVVEVEALDAPVREADDHDLHHQVGLDAGDGRLVAPQRYLQDVGLVLLVHHLLVEEVFRELDLVG